MCLTSSDSRNQDNGDITTFHYHLVDDHDDDDHDESDKEQLILQNSNDNASVGEIVVMFICGVIAYPAAIGIHLIVWRMLKVVQSITYDAEKHESILEVSNFEMAIFAVCCLEFVLLVFAKIIIIPLYNDQKHHGKPSTKKQQQDDNSITKNNDQDYFCAFMNNITKYWKHFLVLNFGVMISSTLIDTILSIVQSYTINKHSDDEAEAEAEKSFLIVSVVVVITLCLTSALIVWIQKNFLFQSNDEQPEIINNHDDEYENKEEESKVELLLV